MRSAGLTPVHGALVVIGILVGWRTLGSTRLVLPETGSSEASAAVQEVKAAESRERAAVEQIRRADSLLTAIRQVGVPADPFHPRSAPRTPPVNTEPVRRDPVVAVPSIVLMAVDAARPQVVLRLGDAVSGLLVEGESWGGWTVTRIRPDGVDVEAGERKAHLEIPRGRS